MKVGSLVELVYDEWSGEWLSYMLDNGIILPVKGKVYTIREIFETENVDMFGVLLEEIINPRIELENGKDEPGFLMHRFRELMPPTSISLESVLENQLQEV
jgi:hypothetical protein